MKALRVSLAVVQGERGDDIHDNRVAESKNRPSSQLSLVRKPCVVMTVVG